MSVNASILTLVALEGGLSINRELDMAYVQIDELRGQVKNLTDAYDAMQAVTFSCADQVVDLKAIIANMKEQINISIAAGGVQYRRGFVKGSIVGGVLAGVALILLK